MARAFWECELYEELLDSDLVDKWSFTVKPSSVDLAGSKDAAAEYIVRSRAALTYSHECHEGCRNKGEHFFNHIMMTIITKWPD